MARMTLKEVRQAVQGRVVFRGSSIFSESFTASNGAQLYVVFSYGRHYPMYVHEEGSPGWYANKDRYSVTTSRHMSAARPDGVEFVFFDTPSMRRLASTGIAGLAAQGPMDS